MNGIGSVHLKQRFPVRPSCRPIPDTCEALLDLRDDHTATFLMDSWEERNRVLGYAEQWNSSSAISVCLSGQSDRQEGIDAMIVTSGDSDFRSARFSTRDLPRNGRLDVYREVMDRTVDKAHIDAVGDRVFFDGNAYRLPELGIVLASASPTRVVRTCPQVEGDDKLFLMMLLEGAATFSQLGRVATVSAGSAILYSGADPLHIERTGSRFFIVATPRAVLEPMIANPSALMSVVPSGFEAVRLLTGYLHHFVKNLPIETPSLRRLAVDHFHDLVATAVGATHDAIEIANGRGTRAARMRAMKADIAQNLEWAVTADILAARHRVSPRYVRKLFQHENTSLSQFVLGQRLVRVYRMLGDPSCAHLTIGTIAVEAGFGDLSTFNRDFRRHFGATPSDVRAAARCFR